MQGDLAELTGRGGSAAPPAWPRRLHDADAVIHTPAARMEFWGGDAGFRADNHDPAVALHAAAVAAAMDLGARLLRRSTPPPLTNWPIAFLGRDRSYDISAARTVLGHRPRVSLETGLLEMVALARGPHAAAR